MVENRAAVVVKEERHRIDSPRDVAIGPAPRRQEASQC